MFGDFFLWIKRKWKQFWCIHEYVAHRGSVYFHTPRICKKCGKYERKL